MKGAVDTDQKKRCDWAGPDGGIYQAYHDREWGVPVFNERVLFEFLILEGFQAGLSWSIILKKRKHFRMAFDRFDPAKIARYGEKEISRLMSNTHIVRNRLKIAAAVKNARAFLAIKGRPGGFAEYIWQFTGGRPSLNEWTTLDETPCRTVVSDAMSKALKSEGFSFVGSKICYAFMQAVGMVNDHIVGCYRYQEIINQYYKPDWL
jgi:DNA-3-methyladenine glycosylase I